MTCTRECTDANAVLIRLKHRLLLRGPVVLSGKRPSSAHGCMIKTGQPAKICALGKTPPIIRVLHITMVLQVPGGGAFRCHVSAVLPRGHASRVARGAPASPNHNSSKIILATFAVFLSSHFGPELQSWHAAPARKCCTRCSRAVGPWRLGSAPTSGALDLSCQRR